jgi:dolichol kinase
MKPSLYLSSLLMVAAASQSASFAPYQSRVMVTPASVGPIPQITDIVTNKNIRHTELNMADTMEERKNESGEHSQKEVTGLPSESGVSKKQSRRKWVAISGVTALTAVCVAAKTGVLPGVPLNDGSFASYTDGMIARDAGSALLALSLAFAFVKFITSLALKGILDPKDSRKIIHTLTGPLFIATWPLFSAAWGARFFAGLVGVVNAIRLILAASGDEEESELANAVSRSGEAKEALGGPFLYVSTITAAILLFWRSSLSGIIAVSTMAAGDGMADLVGRRLGRKNKWPFAKDKSVAGSAAFVVAATLTSTALAAWMSYTGCLTLPMSMTELVPRLFAISALSAAVELVPGIDDNWTVPLAAAVLSIMFLYS